MSESNSNTAVEIKSTDQRRQEAEAMAAMGMISMPGIAALLIKDGEDLGVVEEICGQEAYDHAVADLLQARKEHEAAIAAATEAGRKAAKATITEPKPYNEEVVEAVLEHLSTMVPIAYAEVIAALDQEERSDLADLCGGEIPGTLVLLMATMRHRGTGERAGTLKASKAVTYTTWRGEGVDLVVRLNADRIAKVAAAKAARKVAAKAAKAAAKAAARKAAAAMEE